MLRKALYSAYSFLARSSIESLERASLDPEAAQAARLAAILQTAGGTRFGAEHGLSAVSSPADFRKAVPIRDYEGFRPYIEPMLAGEGNILTRERPFMFATTSGTTGKPKFVPLTDSFMSEYRQASIVSGFNLYRSYPGIARGRALSIVSPAVEGRLPSGIPYGAMTGAIYQKEPAVVKKWITAIPYEAALIKDYESRYYTILRIALEYRISLFYTPNPSTVSLLCRRLSRFAPQLIEDVGKGTLTPPGPLDPALRAAIERRLGASPGRGRELASLLEKERFTPEKIWPELAVISCWTKAAASFYLQDFPEYFGSTPVSDITYGASEGRGTVFLSPDRQMLAINSHYYEFVPEDEIDSPSPTVLGCGEVEQGRNYFILFTTSGGLYRYNINDVVKVTGFHNRAPLIEFLHKGGNIFSFTGEKITESQVTTAMKRAVAATGSRIRFFTVVPCFRPEAHYQLWVEHEQAATPEAGMKALAERFDYELKADNIEYETKRDSARLAPVECLAIEPGTYERLRKHLTASGTPDAQIKLSHLNPRDDVRNFLNAALQSAAITG